MKEINITQNTTSWYIMDIHDPKSYWISVGLMKVDDIIKYRN